MINILYIRIIIRRDLAYQNTWEMGVEQTLLFVVLILL